MKPKIWAIVILFIALFGVRLYAVYGLDKGYPEAQAGVLDLTEWHDRIGNGVVPLRGEWAFYPGELLEPRPGQPLATNGQTRYVNVPGAWDTEISPDRQTPYGFGTYVLKLKFPEGEAAEEYGIFAKRIRTAHKLFADGKLIGQQGEPGTNASATEPKVEQYTTSFVPNGNTAELVIQVSNFDYAHLGGVIEDIQFGKEKSIQRYAMLRFAGNSLMMGFYIVNGLYFLFLFLFRKQSKELLYFCLFFWMSFLFWATHSERLLFWVLPDLSYEWQTKLQSTPSFGLFFSLLLFVRAMFPGIGHAWVVKTAGAVSLGFVCLILTTDVTFFSGLDKPMIVFLGVQFFYTLYMLITAALKGERDGIYTVVAAMCVLIEGLSNALVYTGLAPFTAYIPIERVVFILSMALLIAKRFFTNMQQVEILSQRLIAADSLKNDFLANTSQEIRQPLHGIVNLAQIMIGEGGLGDRKQEERLKLIVATGRRLAQLLNDILDLSKLNEGDFELKLRAVDMRMTVSGVLEVMRYMSGENIRFENRCGTGLPLVKADAQRLMQILFSLLHYSAKWGADGVIAVDAEPGPLPGEVKVTVSAVKSGLVLNAAVPESDFSLEISRRLVELHGGRFLSNLQSPEVLELQFILPVAEEGEEATGDMNGEAAAGKADAFAETASTNEGEASAQGPRALVVESDPITAQILRGLLSQEGLIVTTAADGLQGLKIWENQSEWDLVVMNVMLPKLSGYDLCRKMRERHSFYDLPVLFVTSRNQHSDLLVGFNAGANDYVTQPIDASEFRARSRTLLRMKHSIRDQLHMEMALIQAQIKPHFLYNTLNTIASLSEIDPERTRELLNDFGSYLRGCFDLRNLDKVVPFSKEWTLVKSYLQIEQARFGDRIRITTNVPDNQSFLLPPLTVQPIVENALRHGILTRFSGGNIHIEVREEQDGFLICVQDDGVGIPDDKKEAILSGAYRSGIGLVNVNRRLVNTYGSGLRIESEAGQGTEVSFRIPAAKEESA